MIASHRSVEKGHRLVLEKLGLEPLFDLDLRLGEGTGACLGMSLVQAAVKVLTEMATFSEAGVSERNQ
ncbi:MAG: cobT [Nitrospira sp.]|nr:cobT [Nitrospira sp.]